MTSLSEFLRFLRECLTPTPADPDLAEIGAQIAEGQREATTKAERRAAAEADARVW